MFELRQAYRGLIRRPVYAAACIGTLALVIGVNAALFAAINATLFRPIPLKSGDRTVQLYLLPPGPPDPNRRNPLNEIDRDAAARARGPGPRADLHRRRGDAEGTPRRPEPRRLAAPLRRRSRNHWKNDPARRRSVHGDRRDAGAISADIPRRGILHTAGRHDERAERMQDVPRDDRAALAVPAPISGGTSSWINCGWCSPARYSVRVWPRSDFARRSAALQGCPDRRQQA